MANYLYRKYDVPIIFLLENEQEVQATLTPLSTIFHSYKWRLQAVRKFDLLSGSNAIDSWGRGVSTCPCKHRNGTALFMFLPRDRTTLKYTNMLIWWHIEYRNFRHEMKIEATYFSMIMI